MRQVIGAVVDPGASPVASELLAGLSGISRIKVKDAMQKGAVRLRRPRSKAVRLRRAKALLQPGDEVTLYYDDELLVRVPPAPDCRHDAGRYSVWFKPAGLMTQGTSFGDHCALLRLAELRLRPRPVYPVHRLDREAAGLVILAHDGEAAAVFSHLFAERSVAKGYRVEVCGRPQADVGRIDLPLDGQPALTRYRLTAYDPASDRSALEVETATGRKHQIRRHLEMVGLPVLGDPRYGRGNKDPGGLRLVACRLAFQCPFSGRPMEFGI
jgi:tRNA pseudouridine32 synthase / 23S rRNA pseudouridine746 synthase